MKKIDSLTAEQISAQETFRDISMDVGLATGPTNREAVIPEFKKLYSEIISTKIPNIKPPETFIFVRSPIEAQKVMSFLFEDKNQTFKKWTLEGNDQFVQEILNTNPKIKNHITTNTFGNGSAESSWLYLYIYFRDAVGIKYKDLANNGLNILTNIAKNSGWYYTLEDVTNNVTSQIVVICDRPEIIEMENSVLHCENGPSVKYSDGFCVYNIRGHRVNEKIVMKPETITIKDIHNEENNETKRIMIERFGVSEYLTQTKAKILDKSKLNLVGSVPRILIQDDQGNNWLCCSDGGTGRMYFLPASPEAKTCKQAHEEMCGFSEDRLVAEC